MAHVGGRVAISVSAMVKIWRGGRGAIDVAVVRVVHIVVVVHVSVSAVVSFVFAYSVHVLVLV